MPYKCSAVGCKTNYTSQAKDSQVLVTLHRFPLRDPDLLNAWLRKLARKNFVPTFNNRLCSLHFKDSDFCTVLSDSNLTRRKQLGRTFKLKRTLRSKAIPSIFPNKPSRASLASQKSNKVLRGALSGRRKYFDDSVVEEVSSLDDIFEKVSQENLLPPGFQIQREDEILTFLHENPSSPPPNIDGSLIVYSNLEFEVCVRDNSIFPHRYQHITTSNTIESITVLLNLLTFIDYLTDSNETWADLEVEASNIKNSPPNEDASIAAIPAKIPKMEEEYEMEESHANFAITPDIRQVESVNSSTSHTGIDLPTSSTYSYYKESLEHDDMSFKLPLEKDNFHDPSAAPQDTFVEQSGADSDVVRELLEMRREEHRESKLMMQQQTAVLSSILDEIKTMTSCLGRITAQNEAILHELRKSK